MTQEPVTRNVPPPQEATHNPAPVVQGEFAEVVPANFPQGGTAPSPFTEVVEVDEVVVPFTGHPVVEVDEPTDEIYEGVVTADAGPGPASEPLVPAWSMRSRGAAVPAAVPADVAPTKTTTPSTVFPEPPDNGGVVAVLDAESTEPGAG
jgi:hypothetical protein